MTDNNPQKLAVEWLERKVAVDALVPYESNPRSISAEGDAVYDPFLGSGTTLIAAEQTARKCFGMEISPSYVDVIVRRWQTFTGKSAILQSTNETFEQTEKSRGCI
jgi:DNA methylase